MMKLVFAPLAALLLFCWSVADAAGAQDAGSARQKVDVARLGPQVGERVPDFKLTDQTGRVQTLESIMGPRGAMIVFLRSADW